MRYDVEPDTGEDIIDDAFRRGKLVDSPGTDGYTFG